MESNNINNLIERYLEGDTTLAEEQAIANYLSSTPNLPTELLPIKAMFEAMGAIRQERCNMEIATPQARSKRGLWIGSMIGAAAAAILLFGITTSLRNSPTATIEEPMLICYVNGEQIESQAIALAETNRILEGVASNMENAMAEINRLNIFNK